jgi:hypothetical protein
MPLRHRGRTVLAAAACVAALAGAPSARSTEVAGIRGRSSANPSLAAVDRLVVLAWGATTPEGSADVYVATSRDAGSTFGNPTRVDDGTGQANVSGEQPPRVTLVPRPGADPSIIVVWAARSAAGARLLSAQSNDGGTSFTQPKALPGSEAPGNRGWQAIATARDGHVVAIWLDHRELNKGAAGAASGHSGHQHGARPAQQADAVARAQLSKLLFASVDDASSAQALTGGVCYCCKTAIATGADGSVYAAWRHVYPGNVRDIAFTASRDGGRTFAPPQRVSEDHWVLDGCPENGPALAVDDRNRVHVVWPTLVGGATSQSEPTLALFYASSRDGRQFTPRQRVPTEGFPRHPGITISPRGLVVVTWDEQEPGTRRIALGRGTPDDRGGVRFTRQVIEDAAGATYPVLATTERGVLVAWTSGPASGTRVRSQRVPD